MKKNCYQCRSTFHVLAGETLEAVGSFYNYCDLTIENKEDIEQLSTCNTTVELNGTIYNMAMQTV